MFSAVSAPRLNIIASDVVTVKARAPRFVLDAFTVHAADVTARLLNRDMNISFNGRTAAKYAAIASSTARKAFVRNTRRPGRIGLTRPYSSRNHFFMF